MTIVLIVAIALMVVGAVVFYVGMRKARLRSLVLETQTSKIGSLAGGEFAEVKGTVECDVPLRTPYGGIECVYYRHKRERKEWRRSSSGSKRSRWRTISSSKQYTVFRIRDDSGTIKVSPQKALFDAPRVVEEYVRPGDSVGGGVLGGVVNVAASFTGSGDERVRESAIQVGSEVYALGDVVRRREELYLDKGPSKALFVSHKREEHLVSSLGWWALGLRILGGVIAAGGIGVLVYYLTSGNPA